MLVYEQFFDLSTAFELRRLDEETVDCHSIRTKSYFNSGSLCCRLMLLLPVASLMMIQHEESRHGDRHRHRLTGLVVPVLVVALPVVLVGVVLLTIPTS
jgi:hypothetical protein